MVKPIDTRDLWFDELTVDRCKELRIEGNTLICVMDALSFNEVLTLMELFPNTYEAKAIMFNRTHRQLFVKPSN